MSIKGTAIKLALFSFVLLLCTALLIVVFGQLRFQRYNHYTAEFSNGSGVKGGDFIRAGGVEVGKVADVRLTENGQRVIIDMKVDRSLPLYQSSTAQIRYANLIGDRFVNLERGTGEGADRVLPPGGFIPVARTQPALDLDALIGGFKSRNQVARSREGQQHRLVPGDGVPGPRRHGCRHPAPDRRADLHAGRSRQGHR